MNNKADLNKVYGETLALLAGENEKIIVLDADLAACSKTEPFIEKYPERHFNVGIQEANMVGVAAGFAACGKTPFVHSFGIFTAGRAYDQIRNSVAYPKLNVKIMGIYSGLSNGEDGPTHQCFEELSVMRAVPHMVVMCPCDAHEMALMTKAVVDYEGPCFVRTGRGEVETVSDFDGYKFEIGKGVLFNDGTDVTIIAIGNMVRYACEAVKLLAAEGISARLIDMHTVKPIDEEIILKAAKETGAIVTSEEHNILGGLGGAVAEVVSSAYPVPVIRHGVNDMFGKSGKNGALMERYGLTASAIAACAKKAILVKK